MTKKGEKERHPHSRSSTRKQHIELRDVVPTTNHCMVIVSDFILEFKEEHELFMSGAKKNLFVRAAMAN